MKYKILLISIPRDERGRIDGKIDRRFRIKILMRNKKYPGFLTKKVPYLTEKELELGENFFRIDHVSFDHTLVVPEFILNEINEELTKIGVKPFPEKTADIDVFGSLFTFDLKMMSMKRFWKYYEAKEKVRFKEFVDELIQKIRKPSLKTNILKDVRWVLQIINQIEEFDWTKRKGPNDEPEFSRRYLDPLVAPLRRFYTKSFNKVGKKK